MLSLCPDRILSGDIHSCSGGWLGIILILVISGVVWSLSTGDSLGPSSPKSLLLALPAAGELYRSWTDKGDNGCKSNNTRTLFKASKILKCYCMHNVENMFTRPFNANKNTFYSIPRLPRLHEPPKSVRTSFKRGWMIGEAGIIGRCPKPASLPVSKLVGMIT